MKRKRKTLFFWSDSRDEHDSSSEETSSKHQPQLSLLLKEAPDFRNSLPVPYELLIKIFENVVRLSSQPIQDLFYLSRVCETWREIIIKTPHLWRRIDFTELPITDGNLLILQKLFKLCPSIIDSLEELSFAGNVGCKNSKNIEFYETLFQSPNLNKLYLSNIETRNRTTLPSFILKSITKCKNIHSLSIIQSRQLLANQKWLSDYLVENGKSLEELNLAMSLTSVSSQLFRAIASDYCPKLRILDLSTCDALSTRSFDAVQLAQTMPSLEVLRVANVSFRRVQEAPADNHNLPSLRELSMPIRMRDADRDDALLGTLTYGSRKLKTLDLRGSSVSASALIDMPSPDLRELHIDDTCPLMRGSYHRFIEKWSHSLEILSLVKVNCDKTVEECLNALIDQSHDCKIRELDLSASEVKKEVLKKFLKVVGSLETLNLSSCRSLPRGCKGLYSKKEKGIVSFTSLNQKLK